MPADFSSLFAARRDRRPPYFSRWPTPRRRFDDFITADIADFRLPATTFQAFAARDPPIHPTVFRRLPAIYFMRYLSAPRSPRGERCGDVSIFLLRVAAADCRHARTHIYDEESYQVCRPRFRLFEDVARRQSFRALCRRLSPVLCCHSAAAMLSFSAMPPDACYC